MAAKAKKVQAEVKADSLVTLKDAHFRQLLQIFTVVIDDGNFFLPVGGPKMKDFMAKVAGKKGKEAATDQEWRALAKAANEKCLEWWNPEASDSEKKAPVFKYNPEQAVGGRDCTKAFVVNKCERFKGRFARSLSETFQQPGTVPADWEEQVEAPRPTLAVLAPQRAPGVAPTPAPWATLGAVQSDNEESASTARSPAPAPWATMTATAIAASDQDLELHPLQLMARAALGSPASAPAPAQDLAPPVAPPTPQAPAQEDVATSPGAASSGKAPPSPPPARASDTHAKPSPPVLPKAAEQSGEVAALGLEMQQLRQEMQHLRQEVRHLRQGHGHGRRTKRLAAFARVLQGVSQQLLDLDLDVHTELEELPQQGRDGDSDQASEPERTRTGSTTSSIHAKASRVGRQTRAQVVEDLKKERRAGPGSTTESTLELANLAAGDTRREVNERVKLERRSGQQFTQPSGAQQYLAENEPERWESYRRLNLTRSRSFHDPFSLDQRAQAQAQPAEEDLGVPTWYERQRISQLPHASKEEQARRAPLVLHMKLQRQIDEGSLRGGLSLLDLQVSDVYMHGGKDTEPSADVAFRTKEDVHRAQEIQPQLEARLGVTMLAPWRPPRRPPQRTLWFKNYLLVPLTKQQLLEAIASLFSGSAEVHVEVLQYWDKTSKSAVREAAETEVLLNGSAEFEEESHADALVSRLKPEKDERQQQDLMVLKDRDIFYRHGIAGPIAFARDRHWQPRA